jgi:hypothetical protein
MSSDGYAFKGAAFFLAALGISAPVDQFTGGILFGLAGTMFSISWYKKSLGAAYDAEKGKNEVLLIYSSSIFLMFAVAVLHPILLSKWPLQLAMAVVGVTSRFIAEGLIKIGQNFVKESGTLVSKGLDKVGFGGSNSVEKDGSDETQI